MPPFPGFPPGKTPIDLPAGFFTDLLPLVDDLCELKVLLFCFWALRQKQGEFRYLRRADFTSDASLMRGLVAGANDGDAEALLTGALERAVSHGVLLSAEVVLADENERLYFVNTRRGRAAVEQIESGEWKPGDAANPVEILPERPNIYRLYEANIGLINSARIADELKDAEHDYPREWIQEAIYMAVDSNKRNWRYIRSILERWKKDGKDNGLAGRPAEPNERRYIAGDLADFIEE
jgi:DnaD/phage-associated family protein